MTNRRRPRLPKFFLLALGAMVLTAAPAHANMPTSLLFSEAFHLLAGNAVLGILEGIVVGLLIRGRIGPAIGWMLLANYISALLGVVLLNQVSLAWAAWVLGPPLEHIRSLTILFTLLFFALTYAIEWPLCRLAVGDRPKRGAWTTRANLAAHVVSYLLLVPFYVSQSQTRLLDHLKAAPVAAISAADPVWIYYLDPSGHTRRMRSDGAHNEPVAAEPVTQPEFAWLKAKSTGKNRWDLVEGRSEKLQSFQEFKADQEGRVLLRGSPGDAGVQERMLSYGGFNYYWRVMGPSQEAVPRTGCCSDTVDLRAPDTGNWDVCADRFSWYGLMVKSRANPVADRDALHLGLETPFFAWVSRCPNVLPSGQVIYQLADQIVLVDLDRRLIGFLVRGTGPLAIREAAGRGQKDER